MLSKPWHRFFLAFLLGALGALGFAPLFVLPALLVSLAGAVFLLNQDIEKHSSFSTIFGLGWWFGFGHFTAGLYWIPSALFVNLESLWWLFPFALFGIPAVLAAFIGLCFILTALWPYPGLSRGLAFGAIWVGVEWLRGHVLTGFPWNLLGYAWAFSPEMTQIASLTGIYGLSLITLLIAVSLGYFIKAHPFDKKIACSLCLMVGAGWMWGKYRLTHQDLLPSSPFGIRLVQPNIPQVKKRDPALKEANFQLLLDMTTPPSLFPIKAIIWPESAIFFFLNLDEDSRLLMSELLPEGALLFTGALRRTPLEETPFKVWNSLFVVNPKGEIVTHYDKSHLIPFAEYIPFRNVVDTLFGEGTVKNIVLGKDFTPGTGLQTLSLPQDVPSCTGLICYEAIFPSAVINPTQERPRWMLNISNDAWYGNTSGPYQHFESTRFRAIEEGIPLVRAANTGISAVFDAYGQPLGTLNLNEKNILDALLPPPTSHVPLYGQWGDWITVSLLGAILAFAFLVALKGRQG